MPQKTVLPSDLSSPLEKEQMEEKIASLFLEQGKAINHFLSQISVRKSVQQLHHFLSCRGTLFFTGMGKSGFVAKKIAQTMASTGTKASFLSPVDALHGDIGMVSNDDIFIFLSKSGESDELLALLPHLRNRSVLTIVWSSSKTSRLAQSCDLAVDLPLERELCPFNLSPTTSSTIQMLYGDTITVALMEAKRFPLDAYVQNHPGGSIGQATLAIRDLMLPLEKLSLCSPEQSIEEMLNVHVKKRTGTTLVVERDHRLVGIITDGDIGRGLKKFGGQFFCQTVGKIMTENPKVISLAASAREALRIMEAHQRHECTALPVVDREKVLGLIKLHDILQTNLSDLSLPGKKS